MRLKRHIAATASSIGLLVSVGCLIPPPLEPMPPDVNTPPRLQPARLLPAPTRLPEQVAAACPETETFAAAVEDQDADTIYYRVFVDYRFGGNRTPEVFELSPAPNEAVPLAFSVQLGQLVAPGSFHVVELFVADRPFNDIPSAQEGRDLADPIGLTDTFVWTIELDPTQDSICP